MLAEINLLPERKRKNYATLALFGLLALAAVAVLLLMQHQYTTEESHLKKLEQEYLTIQEQMIAQAESADKNSGGNAFETLADAVVWTKEYPVDFAPIMDELRLKLPNGGFIEEIGYTEANKLLLSVKLEESREGAFLLNRLKEIPYFSSVRLLEMNAEERKEPALSSEEGEEVPSGLEEALPYTATYEMDLDRAAWKELQEDAAEDNEEEGVQDDSIQ
ncbi:hypothetical protein ACQCVE_06520 [Metabacillus sp. 113a]|uniref:hypothetical protein n=1 Tax=Metabacillus sp. 113a TaxID=3404706 RepID=UPI003CF19A17